MEWDKSALEGRTKQVLPHFVSLLCKMSGISPSLMHAFYVLS